MGFHELIHKVQQAETALEARERQTAADWRQAKASWLAIWTPGRIVLATALTGLFASGSAHAAAQEAEHVADATAAGAAGFDAHGVATDAAVTAAALDAQRLYREAGLP